MVLAAFGGGERKKQIQKETEEIEEREERGEEGEGEEKEEGKEKGKGGRELVGRAGEGRNRTQDHGERRVCEHGRFQK